MEKWKDDESEINITAAPPVSLAFQVTEDCIHSCRYCHRRKASERPLKPESWRRLIDSLALRRILRITFTGGEPLLLGKEDIFGIIRYANDKRIHTCLSTTGIAGKDDRHRLNRKDLELLESSLDHLLISLNCIDEESAQSTYGRMEDWKKLLDMAFFLIKECTDLDLILEVCTVVTRKNINSVFQIGEKILTCNPHAYWRVDEYYPNGEVKDRENGRDSALCKEFKLSDGRFELLKNEVKMHFPAQVKNSKIRFNSRRDREKAPDVMLTPTGKLVTSSESIYEQAENPDLRTHSFANRQPYEEYKSYCRFWSWDTQCDLQGYSGKDDFKEWYQCLGKKEIHG